MSPIGSRNSEWIVCPSTFSAATPVGAQIAICFEVFQARCCSSVDLPVPARPVTKTCSLVRLDRAEQRLLLGRETLPIELGWPLECGIQATSLYPRLGDRPERHRRHVASCATD